jgi:hypothetical protein
MHYGEWERRDLIEGSGGGDSITWFLAGSGNVGSSSKITLMIPGGYAAERLVGAYLYLALHLFFPHLLLPSTLHLSLPLPLSTIPKY